MTAKINKILLGMLGTLLIMSLYSCAKKATARNSTASEPATISVAPENKGQILIKRDVNSNYVIQINLRELEAVSKFEADSKNAYIVWMNADKQPAKNLGQINSNTGWLTDKSKASFEAVSEFKPTKIYITEEDNAGVKIPGKKLIWSTNSF